jgi:hypothetical protein
MKTYIKPGTVQIKIRRMLSVLSYCSMLICAVMQAAQATEFDPVDLNAESLQSRRFEQVGLEDLVSACLSVVQDIGFHVVETESAPVVIVANAQGRGFYTLTINVQPTGDDAGVYRIRLMLDSLSRNAGKSGQPRDSAAEADFYQNFFSHLNKTYFRERAMQ